MKRIAYLLVVVMLLACLPLTAFAAKAGETATVNFTASHPGITGFGATLNYDATALEIVSVSYAFGTGHRVGNNVGVMSASTHTGSSLFSVTFKILDGAKAGETYKVTATCTEAYDENVEEISMSISGGSIKIDDCDHSWGAWTGTEATCGAAGHLTRTCSKCGATETDTPAATGNHTWGAWTGTEATCGAAGHLTRTCSVCGATETDTPAATGNHKYEKDESASSDATCGKDGKLVEVCSVCGDTKESVLTATGNHKNGTYTKIDGNDKQHKVSCSVCGKEDELENHSWDKGTVTTPATCGQPGSKTLTCTKCGYEKTEVIDATGKHTYTYTDVNDDQHKVVCSVCGDESMENHNYNAGVVTTKPGHLPGEKTYTCADCGGTKVEVIDPTSDKHVLNSNGWTSYDDTYHYGECECGETMKEKHDWKWVTDKEATKTEAGEKHEECECGAKRNEGTVIKPGKDPVPDTGDITSQVVMTGAVVLVVMMGAVALVFKRKNAK